MTATPADIAAVTARTGITGTWALVIAERDASERERADEVRAAVVAADADLHVASEQLDASERRAAATAGMSRHSPARVAARAAHSRALTAYRAARAAWESAHADAQVIL